MSSRSANVMARIEPEIKDQAEGIISQLGLTASTAINMFYRQIIQERALPFKPSVMIPKPVAYDELTKEQFDARMAIGYSQAMNEDDVSLDEAFKQQERIGEEKKKEERGEWLFLEAKEGMRG